MNNCTIIENHLRNLIAEGIVDRGEEIHTYNGWKARGCNVRRGEHAIAKFPIFKKVARKRNSSEINNPTSNNQSSDTFMITQDAYFFATHQVEILPHRQLLETTEE